MTFESELELSDVFTCHTFIIEQVKLGTDLHWIDILKADREKHLTVTKQLLEHL